jgi:hypothetical protein
LKKENFVFIGNFLHEPNWNAVQYLKETIWPLIKGRFRSGFECLWAYPSKGIAIK